MKNQLQSHVIYMTKLFSYAFLIQCLTMSFLLAENGNAQNQSIDEVMIQIPLHEVSVEKVFSELEKSTGFNFVFLNREIKNLNKVTIGNKYQSLYDVLVTVAQQTQLEFKQVNKNIHVKKSNSNNPVKVIEIVDVTITGKVTDINGDPLPGATVTVAGSTMGTVTDIDGNYSIEAPEEGVLVFSFIGFELQRIAVGNNSTINVTLIEDAKSLEEFVVVGYGTQKKINLTGAVSTLDNKELLNRPVTQTSQALQGKMAGVTVTQNFGPPGSDAGTIRIRGIGTLGDNNPLVLIDGIQGSINDINPNDIESISVLKDAASASIYGSRAASGVILVTTKRGKKGEKLTVNYNAMSGFSSATRLPRPVDGHTYMEMMNEREFNQGRSPLFSDAYMDEYLENRGNEPFFDTNWFNESMLMNTPEQQHTLTVRGGSESISSMVSLGYLKQNALVEDSDFGRISLRMNNNFRITDRFSMTADVFLRKEETNLPNVGGGFDNVFRMMSEIPAIFPALWSDGVFGEGWNGANPLGFIKGGGRAESISSRVLMNIRAKYEFTDWLDFEFGYSPKFLTTNSKNTVKQYDFRRLDGSMGRWPLGFNSLSNSNNRSTENFYQGLLNFNKSFNRHSTSVLLGFEALDFRNDNFSASRQNFLLPQYEVLNAGDQNFMFNSGNAFEWALASYFSRFNYSFSDKYLFEANFRYDGSSRFASENRWGFFPSFSVGWRIIEEDFLKNINAVTDLKIRASWGELGNQNIGNYPYLGTVSLNQPYFFGKNVVQGAAQTILPNRNVTWETTRVLNFGLDFGFFENKLTGSFDVYKKNTIDILYTRDIPLVIGLGPSEQNIAEMENRGWDLQLTWRESRGDLRYSVDFVLSDVKNKVLNLNGLPQYGRNVVFENEEYQAFFGYENVGIYRSQEDLDRYPALNSSVGLGDLIFKDLNGDGIIDPINDRRIIGSNIPRYNFGTTINGEYKNFDLSIFMQGVGRKEVYFATPPNAAFGGTFFEHELDRFIPADPSTHQTANWPKVGGSNSNFETNSFFLYDAKYLRIKSIVFGYSLPNSVLERVSIGNLRVFASAENWFTFDNLLIKTIDPEAPNSSTGSNFYPNLRKVVMGLDIRF